MAIFEAELDDWHRDTGTWPAERTYALFRKWFDLRLYTLIQDLVGEVVGKDRSSPPPNRMNSSSVNDARLWRVCSRPNEQRRDASMLAHRVGR